MSPLDHNKALVIIYSLLGGFFILPILASPLIIAKNVDSYPSSRRGGQVLIDIMAFCVVLSLALLFCSIAYGLYRKRSWGRKLALISVVLLLLYPPLATYVWWVLHLENLKRLYEDGRHRDGEPFDMET
jgi:hypothetical protein